MKLPKRFYDHIGVSTKEESQRKNKKTDPSDNFPQLLEKYPPDFDKDTFRHSVKSNTQKQNRQTNSFRKIDLHSMNVKEALDVCEKALRQAIKANHGKVLFVTGKGIHSTNGISILKKEVFRYLRQQDTVKHVVQAPPHLGGEGAWLVYIK